MVSHLSQYVIREDVAQPDGFTLHAARVLRSACGGLSIVVALHRHHRQRYQCEDEQQYTLYALALEQLLGAGEEGSD